MNTNIIRSTEYVCFVIADATWENWPDKTMIDVMNAGTHSVNLAGLA